jgi:glycosyl transferase family 25
MIARAKELNLKMDIFRGFDSSTRPEQELLGYMPVCGYGGPLAPKDRGCSASHIMLLQQFLSGDSDFLFALEDDVYLPDEIHSWISDLSWWPEGADIVRFEAWGDPQRVHAIGRRAQAHSGRNVVRLYSMHPGTAAYIISRTAATRVLDWTGKMPVAIDHFLFNPAVSQFARRAHVWQVRPALVRQVLPPGEGIDRSAPSRTGLNGMRDAWQRLVKDSGGILGALPRILCGRARLVRPK